MHECVPAEDLPGILSQSVRGQRLVPIAARGCCYTPGRSLVWEVGDWAWRECFGGDECTRHSGHVVHLLERASFESHVEIS